MPKAFPTNGAPAFSPIAFVLLAALLAFGGCINSSFHLDDVTLFSNPAVTSVSGWLQVWQPLQTRPLTYLTFWLNYQLGGKNPVGYHVVNLLLHLLTVWLFHAIAARLLEPHAATIAAALFALHPIQTEPVAYVFERATLVSTLLCLLSMRCWLERRYWPAVGWFALAVLGKEECAAFPVFLLFFARAMTPFWTPFFAMLGISLAAAARVFWALSALHVVGAGAGSRVSPLDYLSTQGVVILRYLRLLVLPYGFTFDADIPVIRDWRSLAAWTAIVAGAALVWRMGRQGRWFAAGLLLLVPSSTIFPADDLAADRRLYLPMIAFAMLGGLLITKVKYRSVVVGALVGLAVLSAFRTSVWRSEQTLWADALAHSPAKLRPRILLARASDPETALVLLAVAEQNAPRDPRPLIEEGLALMQLHRSDMALEKFDRAVALAPNNTEFLNNRGVALITLGRRDQAVRDFQRALELDSCSSRARANLAMLGATYPLPCP